jgi:cellulose synthase (UDP-forming)
MERDQRVAFVQTPQLYENAELNSTTRAAAMQEMLLYDSIMESKGSYGHALCCGSNFVIRIAALDDVGGWDEETVSEDLATSYKIHLNGWTSIYHRRAFAIGMGPATLTSYWKQQKRWASGNTAVAVKIIKDIFTRKPNHGRALTRLDYLWSAGYYMTTLALAAMATIPMVLMIAVKFAIGGAEWYSAEHTRPLEWVYLSVYPLYATVMLFPYVHMRLRGYRIRSLMLLQGLLANTITIYIGSVMKGLISGAKFFVVVPKTGSEPGRHILKSPQTYIFAVLLIIGSLIVDMILKVNPAPFVWILLFWTYFYTLSFAHFFIFAKNSQEFQPDSESQDLADDDHQASLERLTVHVPEVPSQA